MSYGTILADTLQSSTAGVPPQFNDGNGAQVGTLCRAWVQFAGATGAIAASFNVSSITRSGTGAFAINFVNAMPDNKYSAVGSCGAGASGGGFMSCNDGGVPTSSVCYVSTVNVGGTLTDYAYTTFAAFH